MTKTFKNRLFGVLLAVLLVVTGLIGVSRYSGNSVTAYAASGVSYVDENGNTKTANNVTEVTSSTTTWGTDNSTSYYAVNGDVTVGDVQCYGNIVLIICDNKTLNFSTIQLNANASISIYSQSFGDNRGKMVGTNSEEKTELIKCFIGCAQNTMSNGISISGVDILLNGFRRAGGAYIGSAYEQNYQHTTNCGDITIKNAKITIQRDQGTDTTKLNWGR